MIILGIETSCDETAISVLKGKNQRFNILSHAVASQIKTHRRFGGVVPEVAARQHVTSIIPTLDAAIHKSKLLPHNINAIAVTTGPGLITSLRVGVQTAKTLSLIWQKKLISINHIEGHIYANWLGHQYIKFPALCLVVSGGHTELILIKKIGEYQLVGRTRDDAAGEAFDKVAKLLNIGYPGGPKIQSIAKKGNPDKFIFPRPMLDQNNYDFSFSGLKTSVLYLLKKKYNRQPLPLNDLSASFQQAVIDVLVTKTITAARELKVKTILLAGGVAANQLLRQQLAKQINKRLKGIDYFPPPLKLCTDNASMIAIAGYFHTLNKNFADWQSLDADPNWELV